MTTEKKPTIIYLVDEVAETYQQALHQRKQRLIDQIMAGMPTTPPAEDADHPDLTYADIKAAATDTEAGSTS